ncbi:MAG: hypothetical protein ABJN24_06760 [Hyphomicrobiales bacterium]
MNNGWSDYFYDGEKLLWEGQPDTRIFLMSLGDKYRLILAVLWVLFLIYFYNESFDEGALVLVRFFQGLPLWALFLLIGAAVYFTIGRWIMDSYIRRHTIYAISNKRAFIARSAFGKKLDHLPILPTMKIDIAQGELGAITFMEKKSIFKNWNKWGVEDGSFTFRGLPEPEKVYAVIEKLQLRQAKSAERKKAEE